MKILDLTTIRAHVRTKIFSDRGIYHPQSATISIINATSIHAITFNSSAPPRSPSDAHTLFRISLGTWWETETGSHSFDTSGTASKRGKVEASVTLATRPPEIGTPQAYLLSSRFLALGIPLGHQKHTPEAYFAPDAETR